MKKKLLGETVGLGGTPSKPMPSNLFLNIILKHILGKHQFTDYLS